MSISPSEIAKVMKMSQPAVSKVENEADMLVSTLRSYAEAIGCQLDLVLRTPQGVPVRLGSFSDLVTRPKKRCLRIQEAKRGQGRPRLEGGPEFIDKNADGANLISCGTPESS